MSPRARSTAASSPAGRHQPRRAPGLRWALRLHPRAGLPALLASLPPQVQALCYEAEEWFRSGRSAAELRACLRAASGRSVYSISSLASLAGAADLGEELSAEYSPLLRSPQGHIEMLALRGAAGLRSPLGLPPRFAPGLLRHLVARSAAEPAAWLGYPAALFSCSDPRRELRRLRRMLPVLGRPLCLDLSGLWVCCRNLGCDFDAAMVEVAALAPPLVCLSGAQSLAAEALDGSREQWLVSAEGPVPAAVQAALCQLADQPEPPLVLLDLYQPEQGAPRLGALQALDQEGGCPPHW